MAIFSTERTSRITTSWKRQGLGLCDLKIPAVLSEKWADLLSGREKLRDTLHLDPPSLLHPYQQGPNLTSGSEAGDLIYPNQEFLLLVLTCKENTTARTTPHLLPNTAALPKPQGGRKLRG